MKQFIYGFLTVIVLAIIAWFLFKPNSQVKPDTSREQELLQDIKNRDVHIEALTAENDSLKKEKQKIKTQIVYREREIDESIAKDSTNALVWFRQSLTENQELPDGGEVTYRELGLSAKIMSKLPKLELTIDIQDSIIFNQDLIISDQTYTIDSYKQLCEIKDNSTQYWYDLAKRKDSFWYDRFVIVAGVGGGYTGTAIYPFVGLVVGIKLWGSE